MTATAAILTALLVDSFDAPEGITEDTVLDTLDMDSLSLLELAVLLLRDHAIAVAEGELTLDQTVADAAAVLDRKAVAA